MSILMILEEDPNSQVYIIDPEVIPRVGEQVYAKNKLFTVDNIRYEYGKQTTVTVYGFWRPA